MEFPIKPVRFIVSNRVSVTRVISLSSTCFDIKMTQSRPYFGIDDPYITKNVFKRVWKLIVLNALDRSRRIVRELSCFSFESDIW